MNQSLNRLNELSADDARSEFLKCCASRVWAQEMSAARPFATDKELLAQSDRIWRALSDKDWLEAFRAHPKIGERKTVAAHSETAQAWSAQEQSRTQTALVEVLDALAERNREYEKRFGFIFIICATGKSAEEMLSTLERRMGNDYTDELQVAAEEQRRITELRLKKLLETLAR
jgi:OHCU decarboxylase